MIDPGDEELETGTYNVAFGSYGTCRASRTNKNYLKGLDEIPPGKSSRSFSFRLPCRDL